MNVTTADALNELIETAFRQYGGKGEAGGYALRMRGFGKKGRTLEDRKMTTETKATEQFAVIEMMGHRMIAGAIKQSELAPGALIRVDVFGADGHIDRTEHVGSSAIYDITICTEQAAKAAAIAHSPQPSFAYDILRQRPERQLPGLEDIDAEEDPW